MSEELEHLIEVAKRVTPTHRSTAKSSGGVSLTAILLLKIRGSPARWLTSRLRSWPPTASAKRDVRESRAAEPELITDPQLKAEAEAAIGHRQYDHAV